MGMFRRSRKPAPPLHRKQQEIAQQEAQLREKVESLERLVTESRAPAQNKSAPQKPDRSATANVVERRFHVSIAMDAPQVFDADRKGRRPRAMRKERRQGRIVFLILLAALGVAVMLLINHLYP
jgi:hypothetical protein